MKRYLILTIGMMFPLIWGCSNLSTREEIDTYAIVNRDTTRHEQVQNVPGNRDNGLIVPSSRTIHTENEVIRADSFHIRKYPDFIRLGVFESVGLMFSGESNNAAGTGLFGLFPSLDSLRDGWRGSKDLKIPGGLYRFGIGEWRLRWFRDAANWTIGTSIAEAIIPDARIEKALLSVFPIYVRKRYFLNEDIPYVAFTPAFGIGWYPSQYLNMSGSLDFGSVGGLNFRIYAGLAVGNNSASSPQVKASTVKGAQTSVIPYAGFGVSVLDFLNRVPETQKEWSEYHHSSWEVGLLQATVLASGADRSIFGTDSSKNAISGMILRVANASVAIPIPGFNNNLYAGTSLINLAAMGSNEWGLGILPVRVGYWQTVLADELATEPFIEYSYYPSKMFHVGNRLSLRVGEMMNLSLSIGYVSGSTDEQLGGELRSQFGRLTSFNRAYIGIGLSLFDRIFFPEELRYYKGEGSH